MLPLLFREHFEYILCTESRLFNSQIVYPSVFSVMGIYSRNFYKFIKSKDCCYYEDREIPYKCCKQTTTHQRVTISHIMPKRVSPPAGNIPDIIVELREFPTM